MTGKSAKEKKWEERLFVISHSYMSKVASKPVELSQTLNLMSQ